jgi:hypothetical protein
MAVYTIATLAPAFRTSRACLPFVIPPVAKMTFSRVFLAESWEGVERDVGGGVEEVDVEEVEEGVEDEGVEGVSVFFTTSEAEETLDLTDSAAFPTADLTAEGEEVTTAGVVVGVEEPGKGICLSGI